MPWRVLTPTNGSRLLELARDLSAGLMDADEQRELGCLLYDAALWGGNPLRQLSPVGQAIHEGGVPTPDIARIETALRDALTYVGQRVDGTVDELAERAELWMRESQCLIASSARLAQRERAALEFYRSRCTALQVAQAGMREPERTTVCSILANGRASADGR